MPAENKQKPGSKESLQFDLSEEAIQIQAAAGEDKLPSFEMLAY